MTEPALDIAASAAVPLELLRRVVVASCRRMDPNAIDRIDLDLLPAVSNLVEAAARERLTGPLLWCVANGIADIDGADLEALETAHVDALAWCLRIESVLWSVTGWLSAEGIRPLVVKGPAIAHLDEHDPSLRTFADLDLLVRGEDLPLALGLLAQRGAVRPYAERRGGYDRRFAKSVTVTLPHGVEIDLHRTLCDGVHGLRLPVEELHRDPESFRLGGRDMFALDPIARVLHSAYHAVLGSPAPRLSSLRDLIGYLSRAESDGSMTEIIAVAERWGGTAVLAQAIRESLLPGVDLPAWTDWLARTRVDPAEVTVVADQRRDGSSFRLSRFAAARELDSLRDRAAYLAAAALPSTRHLRSRGRSRFSALRRGLPTVDEPVVLPDLLPRRDERDRLLIVSSAVEVDRYAAPLDDSAFSTVHVILRGGADELRSRWAASGRTATVMATGHRSNTVGHLREVVIASDELRRFDPDVVAVHDESLWLVAPSLLFGRRRLVMPSRTEAAPPAQARRTLDRALWRLVGLRHRLATDGHDGN